MVKLPHKQTNTYRCEKQRKKHTYPEQQDWKTNPAGNKTSQLQKNTTGDQCGSAKQDNKPQVELITEGRKLVLMGTQAVTGVLSKIKWETWNKAR